MQFFRKLFNLLPITSVAKRNFAQVHDIQIKVNDRVLGSMERNGTLLTLEARDAYDWTSNVGYADTNIYEMRGLFREVLVSHSTKRDDVSQAQLRRNIYTEERSRYMTLGKIYWTRQC